MKIEIIKRASLEVLRAEAIDERSVVVDERLRHGEDPWEFMQEIPTVDELVMWLLRRDWLTDHGGIKLDDAGEHELLVAIGDAYPGLRETANRYLHYRHIGP